MILLVVKECLGEKERYRFVNALTSLLSTVTKVLSTIPALGVYYTPVVT